MAVLVDTEFLQNHTTVVLNVSSKERLIQLVTYLINCPDPANWSKPGEHAHFFIIDTKKMQIHVNKNSAPECIKHFIATHPTPQPVIPNYSDPNNDYDAAGELKEN